MPAAPDPILRARPVLTTFNGEDADVREGRTMVSVKSAPLRVAMTRTDPREFLAHRQEGGAACAVHGGRGRGLLLRARKETPLRAKGILFAALGYFILPADTIPDMIFGLGFTDDVAVLTAALAAVRAHLKPAHWRPRERRWRRISASSRCGHACLSPMAQFPAQLLPLSWLSSACKGLSAVACPGGGRDGGCGIMAAMKLLARQFTLW